MREVSDALRSLQKYVSQVFDGDPPLAQITFGGTSWSLYGQVAGAITVPDATWRWLLARDRNPAVTHGAPSNQATYYQESVLAADPHADATAAGIDLTTGAVVSSTAVISLGVWEVRTWADRGEYKEPFCRVGLVGGASIGGPALFTDITQPFSIECYPVPGASADESLIEAAVVQSALIQAFALEGVAAGRPKRVPLWDYKGVPLDSTSNARGGSDYMRLVDFSTNILPYPDDPKKIGVVCDLRLSWTRAVDRFRMRDRNDNTLLGTHVTQQVRQKQTPS